ERRSFSARNATKVCCHAGTSSRAVASRSCGFIGDLQRGGVVTHITHSGGRRSPHHENVVGAQVRSRRLIVSPRVRDQSASSSSITGANASSAARVGGQTTSSRFVKPATAKA